MVEKYSVKTKPWYDTALDKPIKEGKTLCLTHKTWVNHGIGFGIKKNCDQCNEKKKKSHSCLVHLMFKYLLNLFEGLCEYKN